MQDLTLIVFYYFRKTYTSIVSGSNLVIHFSRKETLVKHLISVLLQEQLNLEHLEISSRNSKRENKRCKSTQW